MIFKFVFLCLGPNGELRKYLQGVADAEDVQSYVKDHRLGQAAITPSHPNWSFYAKIVRSYGKNEEAQSSSAKWMLFLRCLSLYWLLLLVEELELVVAVATWYIEALKFLSIIIMVLGFFFYRSFYFEYFVTHSFYMHF